MTSVCAKSHPHSLPSVSMLPTPRARSNSVARRCTRIACIGQRSGRYIGAQDVAATEDPASTTASRIPLAIAVAGDCILRLHGQLKLRVPLS
jgi:hypothetical protein